ncbi:MAG TPA: cytochrome c [Puia sp.]|nr:cytochrome c [Puia sp.]
MQYLLTAFLGAASLCFAATQSGDPSKDRGAIVYKQFCLACHQADGSGVPMANPPLVRTSYVTGDKRKLITWVLKGTSAGKEPIDGKRYPNNMAPMSFLTDQQIADVLTYIRSSFGNQAPAVSRVEVKKMRDALK